VNSVKVSPTEFKSFLHLSQAHHQYVDLGELVKNYLANSINQQLLPFFSHECIDFLRSCQFPISSMMTKNQALQRTVHPLAEQGQEQGQEPVLTDKKALIRECRVRVRGQAVGCKLQAQAVGYRLRVRVLEPERGQGREPEQTIRVLTMDALPDLDWELGRDQSDAD
jgi:hypothetical protein